MLFPVQLNVALLTLLHLIFTFSKLPVILLLTSLFASISIFLNSTTELSSIENPFIFISFKNFFSGTDIIVN